MKKLGKYVIGAAVLGTATACFSAAAVTPIADDRMVESIDDNGVQVLTPSLPFAQFNVNGQFSTLSSTLFSCAGSGFGYSDFDFFIRESTFDVTFEVTEPTLMILNGGYSVAPGNFGSAAVTIALSQDDSDVYATELNTGFGAASDTFSATRSLGLGTYRMFAYTAITPGGFDTDAQFNFDAVFRLDMSGDADGDGATDAADNCTNAANPGQQDADGDGYGNACDADLNNDCEINAVDLGLLRQAFFSSDPVADLNSDGVVNVVDLGVMGGTFFGAPGPAAAGNCP